jgi:hypothetical protein
MSRTGFEPAISVFEWLTPRSTGSALCSNLCTGFLLKSRKLLRNSPFFYGVAWKLLNISKFSCITSIRRSRDSSVGITTGYGLDDRGVGVRVPVVKNFYFSTLSRPALGSTQPPIQWVPGALSAGVKRPGRKADHSSPASAEVKNMWMYTSTPPYAFMA